VGAQAGEQLHGLQQIGFPFPIGTDHQQPRSLQLQFKAGDIAEVEQLQAMQPDGSGAVCG
jgi:hypothetical protein